MASDSLKVQTILQSGSVQNESVAASSVRLAFDSGSAYHDVRIGQMDSSTIKQASLSESLIALLAQLKPGATVSITISGQVGDLPQPIAAPGPFTTTHLTLPSG